MKNKQHHISYESVTNTYWFILPDDTEKQVFINQIEDIDFNIIYRWLYYLCINKPDLYSLLKGYNIEHMCMKLQEYYNKGIIPKNFKVD